MTRRAELVTGPRRRELRATRATFLAHRGTRWHTGARRGECPGTSLRARELGGYCRGVPYARARAFGPTPSPRRAPRTRAGRCVYTTPMRHQEPPLARGCSSIAAELVSDHGRSRAVTAPARAERTPAHASALYAPSRPAEHHLLPCDATVARGLRRRAARPSRWSTTFSPDPGAPPSPPPRRAPRHQLGAAGQGLKVAPPTGPRSPARRGYSSAEGHRVMSTRRSPRATASLHTAADAPKARAARAARAAAVSARSANASASSLA